jgi:uncharacterized protein (DUF2336 family)
MPLRLPRLSPLYRDNLPITFFNISPDLHVLFTTLDITFLNSESLKPARSASFAGLTAVPMGQTPSLIAELEDAIQSGSKDKRVDTLRRITDLFVADADRFSDQQIEVFDDVLGHLIKRIQGKALTELSQRLAPVNNAPLEVVRRLARDDDITIAAPVLRQSTRLTDADLVDVASTKNQGHLLAIAARPTVATQVTDVLLRRGDRDVFHTLAENAGADFSESGFATLAKHAEKDEHLAESVGLRFDVPLAIFRQLLLRATEVVRSRLLALAGPESRDRIRHVLAAICEDTQHEADLQKKRDFAAARVRVAALKNKGELNEAVILELARTEQYADLLASLSSMCGAPMTLVDVLLQSDRREGWLIPCKVAGLDWSTVRAILSNRLIARPLSDQTLEAAREDYFGLSQAGAGRVLRFWQVRQSAAQEAVPGGLKPLAAAGAPASGSYLSVRHEPTAR